MFTGPYERLLGWHGIGREAGGLEDITQAAVTCHWNFRCCCWRDLVHTQVLVKHEEMWAISSGHWTSRWILSFMSKDVPMSLSRWHLSKACSNRNIKLFLTWENCFNYSKRQRKIRELHSTWRVDCFFCFVLKLILINPNRCKWASQNFI